MPPEAEEVQQVPVGFLQHEVFSSEDGAPAHHLTPLSQPCGRPAAPSAPLQGPQEAQAVPCLSFGTGAFLMQMAGTVYFVPIHYLPRSSMLRSTLRTFTLPSEYRNEDENNVPVCISLNRDLLSQERGEGYHSRMSKGCCDRGPGFEVGP